MNKSYYLIILAALALTLGNRSALHAAEPPARPEQTATPATPATPAAPDAEGGPATPAERATPATPPTKPEAPESSATDAPAVNEETRSQVGEQMRKAIEEARKQRADYQAQRAELLRSLKGADAQAREEIRAKLKENREAFLTQQRENRSELRKQIQQLKESLPDHKDALDQAREKTRTRKGGDE